MDERTNTRKKRDKMKARRRERLAAERAKYGVRLREVEATQAADAVAEAHDPGRARFRRPRATRRAAMRAMAKVVRRRGTTAG